MHKFLLGLTVAALVTSTAVSGQDRPNLPQDRGPRPEMPGDRRPPPNSGPRPGRPRPPAPSRPRPPNWGHRPPHHYLSQGRWRPSLHGPAYRYPPGFRYRRWLSGAILPPLFLGGAYFYDNF